MYKEFQLVQNFNGHPHIAAYLYFMIDHDKSHLIMEYVQGGSLMKDIKMHPKSFTIDKIISFIRQMVSALKIMFR